MSATRRLWALVAAIGCLVAAGVAFVGAVAAAVFLPGKVSRQEEAELAAMGSYPGLDDLAPDPA